MNNKIFIDRCETLIVTMKAGNYAVVTCRQVARWLKCSEAVAGNFLAKMCKMSMLQKQGAASKTSYKLTEWFSNSLLESLNKCNGDVGAAAKKTVAWFVEHPKVAVHEITTATGNKITKVVSSEKLSEEAQTATNYLLAIIKQNGDLLAEVQLLREEVQRLSEYEQKYKQIKSLMK